MIETDVRVVGEFIDKLLSLDRLGAEDILDRARQNTSPLQVVEELIIPALEEVGRGWEQGSVALAQVYMGSRICEDLVELFLPSSSPERTSKPLMAISLLDDYHGLGKTIVYTALRASGYELMDYGRLTVAELVRRVCADSTRIILISTLMLRSALQVREVKEMLAAAGCQAKIVVGGAPFRFDPRLWQEVGADAMGATAADAIKVVTHIIEEEL
ncbi:MAG: cobalamin-dependent protein [Thermodesulfobacteriota bacterium]